MKEKIIAYEWHNEETGHCYVDYVAHNLMDENNGYTKTPLYKYDRILYMIGHELGELIDAEVEKRIAERMPTKEEMESEIDQNPMDMVYAGGFAECYEWLCDKMKGGEK